MHRFLGTSTSTSTFRGVLMLFVIAAYAQRALVWSGLAWPGVGPTQGPQSSSRAGLHLNIRPRTRLDGIMTRRFPHGLDVLLSILTGSLSPITLLCS